MESKEEVVIRAMRQHSGSVSRELSVVFDAFWKPRCHKQLQVSASSSRALACKLQVPVMMLQVKVTPRPKSRMWKKRRKKRRKESREFAHQTQVPLALTLFSLPA